MEDQQFTHYCCGTNSTKASIQTPWCFNIPVRIHCCLPRLEFIRMKPFSFQTFYEYIIMVQKSVEITSLVSLCACVSILGIYWTVRTCSNITTLQRQYMYFEWIATEKNFAMYPFLCSSSEWLICVLSIPIQALIQQLSFNKMPVVCFKFIISSRRCWQLHL
jgi:hypothetical protein